MRVAITGASSGIGAATATLLKANGAQITVFDIADPGHLADQWIAVDFSDPDNIPEAIAQCTGTFDALLNIAGIPPRDDNAAAVLTVNWLSVKVFTEQFLDRLNPNASIVNLASRAGAAWADNLFQIGQLMDLKTTKGLADWISTEQMDPTRAYCLSKEALIVWTKLRTEQLATRDLRMNCVSPSAVDTAILSDFVKALGVRAIKTIERIGRPATPDDISPIAVFLASPESAWLRGVNIDTDGGISAMVMAEELTAGPLSGK